MHKISDLPQAPSNQPSSYTDADVSGVALLANHSPSVARYLRHAVQILSEQDLAIPDWDQLTLIVRCALDAQSLFFAASIHDPSRTKLRQFFESFVLSCVTFAQETEAA
jgi:hypothetical protein